MRILLKLLVALALGLSLGGAVHAATAGLGGQRFASQDQLLQFMNTYRARPRPKLLAPAIHSMSDFGLLGDEEASGMYVGFIAGVVAGNQLKAESLIAGALPMRPDEQAAVVKGIAYSGLPNWRSILNDFVLLMPERRILIDHYVTGQAPLLMDIPVDSGRTLDTLWGYYLATGYYEPVQRIIGALAWSSNRDDLDKLLVGSMAKWTLATNAARDPGLLKLFYTEAAVQPEPVAKPLKDVIQAVEVAETGRIKKEALAAIDELKAKGPASKRTIAWGTELGATAIAVGCVVAGVTGHAELGVPCVVSGALTQAAGKVLTSDSFSAKSLGFQ